MKKLAELRSHLLKAELGITTDQLHVSAREGTVVSYWGKDNSHFTVIYTAEVLIVGCREQTNETIHKLLVWLSVHQPSRDEKALQYDVDIIDHDSFDLRFQAKLIEEVKVEQTKAGINIQTAAEPNLSLLPDGNGQWPTTIESTDG